MNSNKEANKYIPEICTHCEQTTEYLVRLDRGSAYIVIAIAHAVRRLGRNRVHLRNDMELSRKEIDEGFGGLNGAVDSGFMDSKMVGNILRPKYFGLVAQVDGGGRGEYLLTPRGAQFLRGVEIESAAVVQKKTHSKLRYWEHGGSTTIGKLLKRDIPFWNLEDIYRGPVIEALANEQQPTLGV